MSDPVARQTAGARPQATGVPRTGGVWDGWIGFAVCMLFLLGGFHAFTGVVALVRDDFYLVTDSGLVISADYTLWGWGHLLIAAFLVATAVGLMSLKTWARGVTVVIAALSALTNMAFMGAYPWWSVIMIALDIVIIYAVTVHGSPDALEP